VTNEDLARDAHWFDGDGMLCGVMFRKTEAGVQPEFVNRFILTDVFLSSATSPRLRRPILPSISTLANPFTSLLTIAFCVLRTLFLVLLSHLPGSSQIIQRISVANTSILYHDGRALTTCESGPPMRVTLPELETIGWFNGRDVEGEPNGEGGPGFGGSGLFGSIKEWTTGHPRVDPKTSELILFHSTFIRPYIHYSIVPATFHPKPLSTPLNLSTYRLNVAVPGVSGARMMHDFGVSSDHTVILDLPLSLDPRNLVSDGSVVSYDALGKSRFGVFPRYEPEKICWFETSACCIFHTANTWSSTQKLLNGNTEIVVNMLTCRLNSATLVFTAGNIPAPIPIRTTVEEEEQCRLYYYQFSLSSLSRIITHQWALSAVPFEFPSLRQDKVMSQARYIYGCSLSNGTFSAALGRAAKIDCLVKVDVDALIDKGIHNPPNPVTGCVDNRTITEILESTDPVDPIKAFKMPTGWYAQESRFVPREGGTAEDDGWILSYVFDESQLDDSGECQTDATSELWIVDAKDMKTVVGRVRLPQRVPYGLHGAFFPEQEVLKQRPIERIRSVPSPTDDERGLWNALRRRIELFLG
jgi:carotenoid cleavage dioxygenase-like enzyme